MQSINRQAGFSFYNVLAIFMLAIVLTGLGVKIIPIHLDFMSVDSVLDDMKRDTGTRSMTPAEIKSAILKRLDINRVTDVGRDDIEIGIDSGMMIVGIDYEVRTKLFANIDLVMVYSKEVKVMTQQ